MYMRAPKFGEAEISDAAGLGGSEACFFRESARLAELVPDWPSWWSQMRRSCPTGQALGSRNGQAHCKPFWPGHEAFLPQQTTDAWSQVQEPSWSCRGICMTLKGSVRGGEELLVAAGAEVV